MNDPEKLERLEGWAVMAAQELQEFVDAAVEDSRDENALPGVQQLIKELDAIIYNDWRDQLANHGHPIAALED